jgi:hypothetical protein
MATRASNARPTVRVVKTRYDGDLVLEVREDGFTLRPPRTRRGGANEVTLTWGAMYQRLMAARAE